MAPASQSRDEVRLGSFAAAGVVVAALATLGSAGLRVTDTVVRAPSATVATPEPVPSAPATETAGPTRSATGSTTTTTPIPTTTVPPTTSVAEAPIARPMVILYGDSLAWEAQEHVFAAFGERPDVRLVSHTYGGTAICDWLEQMRADAPTLLPGAVIVEFSGNAFTPCMLDSDGLPLTGAAFLDRYQADAEAVVDIFAPIGAEVMFVGTPISASAEAQGYRGGTLNDVYAAFDGRPGVEYVDAGAAVLDDGHWTATLPCLPDEPCTGGTDASGQGVNVVRAPDGGHFCPAADDAVRGVTGECPVWSSGAYRFAQAMVHPVLERLSSGTA